MKLLSNLHNGGHVTLCPTQCVICDKIVFFTQHTEYGHLFVCPEHTDEELAAYAQKAGIPLTR